MKLQPTRRDKCGTYAGWNAHQAAGEYKCQPCNDANRDYRKAYRRRTGETRATLYTDAEIYAIRNETAVKLQELIHAAEDRRGALYCRVTTNEIRRALGMDCGGLA